MIKFFFRSNLIEMRFSEWLTTYRKEAEVSQKKLAFELEKRGYQISDAQISNYEREYDKDKDGNPTRPPERFVELTAQILNRPIDEARAAAGYNSQNNPTLPPQIRINDFDGFDDDDLNDIAEYIAFKKSQKEKAQ